MLPGVPMYSVEGGRIALHFNEYGSKEEHYELWEWDGSTGVRGIGSSGSRSTFAALICGVDKSAITTVVSDAVCVGRRLIANSADGAVVVWVSDHWVVTGAHLQLNRVAHRSQSQLILSLEDYDRVQMLLKPFSVPIVVEPPALPGASSAEGWLEAVACGPNACWAVDGSGRLLVIDLRGPAPRWRKIGKLSSVASLIVLDGDERAVFTTSGCATAFYLALPSLDRLKANERDGRPGRPGKDAGQ